MGLRRAEHSKRGAFRDLAPVHVTTRVVRGLPTLRSLRAARALKAAFLAGRERRDFRLVHFSVMSNHLHLIVEADDSRALSRGVQGLLVRIAHHLNSALRRSGRVFADRFHSRVLTSTLDVKNTLLYVLANARRHGIPFVGRVDPYSSAAWFTGWHELAPSPRPAPTATPRSWQLLVGWHLHGRLSSDAIPRAAHD